MVTENVEDNSTIHCHSNSPARLQSKSHNCNVAAPIRAANFNIGDSSLTEVTPVELTHVSVRTSSPTRSVSANSRLVSLSGMKGACGKAQSASVSAGVTYQTTCNSLNAQSLATSSKAECGKLKETGYVSIPHSACNRSPNTTGECIQPSDSVHADAEEDPRQENCLLLEEDCPSKTDGDGTDDVARAEAIKNYGVKLQAVLSELSDNLNHRELTQNDNGLCDNQTDKTTQVSASHCKLTVLANKNELVCNNARSGDETLDTERGKDESNDEFEILQFQQCQVKPRRNRPLLEETSSKQLKSRGSVQRRQRGKASKPVASSEFTVGTNSVSGKDRGSVSTAKESLDSGKHSRFRKKTISESSTKVGEDQRITQDADTPTTRTNSKEQITVDSQSSESGNMSKKRGRCRFKATKSTEQKENKKTSVYDMEPDSEEENLTGKPCLDQVKDKRAVVRRGRSANVGKPTGSGKQVRRPPAYKKTSSKSQSDENSKIPVRRRLESVSTVIGNDVSGREDQTKAMTSAIADVQADSDSQGKAGADSKPGLKGRRTRHSSKNNAADEERKKVDSSAINPTCSLTVFDGGDGLTTYAKSVICTTRQLDDIATLPALTGFSSSSFITSTPLPPRQRALSLDPQHSDCGDTVATDFLVTRKTLMNAECSSRRVSFPDHSNASNKLCSTKAAIKPTRKLEIPAKQKRKRGQVIVLGVKRRRLTNNRSAKKLAGRPDTGFFQFAGTYLLLKVDSLLLLYWENLRVCRRV
jgi:hypothetical protein